MTGIFHCSHVSKTMITHRCKFFGGEKHVVFCQQNHAKGIFVVETVETIMPPMTILDLPCVFSIFHREFMFFLKCHPIFFEIQQHVPLQKISKVTKVQDFVAHSHRLHPWHDKFCRGGFFPDFLSPQKSAQLLKRGCVGGVFCFLPFWILISYSWQFFVPFWGWLSDHLERLSDLQLGNQKVTLNHLV